MSRFLACKLLVCCVPLLPLLPHLPSPETSQPQEKTAPYKRHGRYLGAELCQDCHEEEAAALEAGNLHRAVLEDSSLQGCETCHGPGLAHGDDEDNDPTLITFPPKLAGKSQKALCGRCHRQEILSHGGDLEGFFLAGKTCTACHRVHRQPAPPRLSHTEAQAVGTKACIACHPRRNTLLETSHHSSLAAGSTQDGCETCHGPGSLHVESGGLSALITKPGPGTCRSCHTEVDAREFHWRGKPKPLLNRSLSCSSCHRVHEAPDSEAWKEHQGKGKGKGNRSCARCHQQAVGILEKSVHASLSCDSCHAGARRHAGSGGMRRFVDSLKNIKAAQQQKLCGSCHQKDEALRHVGRGAHKRHGVSCLSCHSAAAPKGKVQKEAEATCADCHQQVAMRFRLPNHHPVPEGRMGCASCHEPHGARRRLNNRELRQRRCVACHRKYRGPFVFAHNASRRDGCVVCHDPHGSSNRRLLKQHRSQQNCLQCHADFPAFHDQSSGAVFTNCLNCHSEIHGSNHSRYFFR